MKPKKADEPRPSCSKSVPQIFEKEDEVAEGVSKHGADHQVPSSINVRPWTRENGQDERDDGLDDVVVGLQLGNVGLHPVLFVLVVLDVVAYLLSDVHVDLAVQALFL